MKTNLNIESLKSLKRQHSNKQEWLKWFAKLEAVAASVGGNTETDLSDEVTAQNFIAAGFTAEEAEAFVFVMTQDCMGRACTSVEQIERWFCYEMPNL